MMKLPSIASTDALLTGDETEDDSFSLCYDADAEQEDEQSAGGPPLNSPERTSRENRRLRHRQQPSSLCSSGTGTTWRWWGADRAFPRLHLGVDTTFTSLLSSSDYDDAQRKGKRRPASNRDPKRRKRKKMDVAPPPKSEFIGFVNDLSELLLATYREAQSMDVGGPSHSDYRPKNRVDGTSVNKMGERVIPGEAESSIRAHSGANSSDEGPGTSEGLAFLVSSLSNSGSFVLAPNVRKLDDVLMSFSDSPRVIVEAEAPFRTVHANAAYQRLARDTSVADGQGPRSNKSNDRTLEAPSFESSTVVYALRPDPKKCVSHYLVELLPNAMIEVIG